MNFLNGQIFHNLILKNVLKNENSKNLHSPLIKRAVAVFAVGLVMVWGGCKHQNQISEGSPAQEIAAVEEGATISGSMSFDTVSDLGDDGAASASNALSLTASTPPRSDTNVYFGALVSIGKTRTVHILLQNGGTNVRVSNLDGLTAPYSISQTETPEGSLFLNVPRCQVNLLLNARARCFISLSFSPTASGDYYQTLNYRSVHQTAGTLYTLPIKLEGHSSSVVVGDVVGQTSTNTDLNFEIPVEPYGHIASRNGVAITNAGTLSAPFSFQNSSSFPGVGPNACKLNEFMPFGTFCTVYLRFRSATVGNFDGNLSLSSRDIQGYVSNTLLTFRAAAVSAVPAEVNGSLRIRASLPTYKSTYAVTVTDSMGRTLVDARSCELSSSVTACSPALTFRGVAPFTIALAPLSPAGINLKVKTCAGPNALRTDLQCQVKNGAGATTVNISAQRIGSAFITSKIDIRKMFNSENGDLTTTVTDDSGSVVLNGHTCSLGSGTCITPNFSGFAPLSVIVRPVRNTGGPYLIVNNCTSNVANLNWNNNRCNFGIQSEGTTIVKMSLGVRQASASLDLALNLLPGSVDGSIRYTIQGSGPNDVTVNGNTCLMTSSIPRCPNSLVANGTPPFRVTLSPIDVSGRDTIMKTCSAIGAAVNDESCAFSTNGGSLNVDILMAYKNPLSGRCVLVENTAKTCQGGCFEGMTSSIDSSGKRATFFFKNIATDPNHTNYDPSPRWGLTAYAVRDQTEVNRFSIQLGDQLLTELADNPNVRSINFLGFSHQFNRGEDKVRFDIVDSLGATTFVEAPRQIHSSWGYVEITNLRRQGSSVLGTINARGFEQSYATRLPGFANKFFQEGTAIIDPKSSIIPPSLVMENVKLNNLTIKATLDAFTYDSVQYRSIRALIEMRSVGSALNIPSCR